MILLRLFVIPKVFQKLELGCVKAPAAEFPQVGLYLEHKTHLRDSHFVLQRFINFANCGVKLMKRCSTEGIFGPGALTQPSSNF